MKPNMMLHVVAMLLVLVGALNWGFIGLFNMNLVNVLLGMWPTVERIVYILVGLSAVYIALTHKMDCKTCAKLMK